MSSSESDSDFDSFDADEEDVDLDSLFTAAPPVSSEAKLSYAAPSAQTSALEQVVVDGLVGNEVNLNENITYDDSVRSKPATRTVNNVAFATSTTAFGSHQFLDGFGDDSDGGDESTTDYIDSTTRTAVSHAGNTSPSARGTKPQQQQQHRSGGGGGGGGGDRDDDLDSQESGAHFPEHQSNSEARKARTQMLEKQPSGVGSWFSCCSKKSSAVQPVGDADESGADTESSKTDLGGTQKKPTASSSSMDASQRESNIKWQLYRIFWSIILVGGLFAVILALQWRTHTDGFVVLNVPDDQLPVNIQLNAESCRVDFQVIHDESLLDNRGLEIIYRATRLGNHTNFTESFKVTTSDTAGAPEVGYVGRSYDALYQTGLHTWTDSYATARSRYPVDKFGLGFGFLEPINRTGRPPPPSDSPGHYIWTTKNIWPSGHFGDAVVNVLQDPPYCGNEFTRSNCSSLGIETKECAPTGESEYNSQGYHIRTTCNGEIVDPRNISSSEANSANVRNVSGTVATLCPAMCKDEQAWHNIIIDVNTIFMGEAAAETTDEMSVEMDEDGGGGGTGTNSSDFDDFIDLVAMAKLLPSAIGGQRECHLIVKVGSSFTLGNLVATVNSSNAGISGASNHRYIRAHQEELEVSIDSNTFEGAVDIKGSRLNLRARSMTASSVSVSVEGGIVDLDNVEVHDTAAGIAVDVTHDGDIIISPKGPVVVDLEWKQPCGYVCLPQGYWVDDSECNVEEEDEELGPGATSSTTTTTRTTTTTTTITTTTTTTTLLNDGSNSTNSTDTPTDTPAAARDPFQVRECQKRTACGSTVTGIQFLGFKSTLTELFAHPHWVHYDSKGPVPGSYTAKGSRYSNADGSGYNDDDGEFTGDRAEAPEAPEAPGGYSHGDTRGRLRIAASAQIGSIYLHDSVRAARNALLEVTAAARSALNPSAGSNRSISGGSDNATNNGYTMPPPPLGAKAYLPNQTQLSDKLKYDLAPLLNSSFSEYEDFVYRVLLSTFDPESFWLASTKEVYLQFEPGIIAAFSATLLNPWSAAFYGRLYPGFCPYRPEPSTYERGLVSELLVSAIEGFQNKSGATLGHRTKDGVWKYTKETQSIEVDGALVVEQPFSEKEIHIRDNSYLKFAIVLSLILAAGGGIGITLGCVFGIKYILIAFMRMKDTNKRQVQFAKDKAKADSRPATARSKKEKDMKEKKKDQNDTGLIADPSAASPFELIDTLAAIYKAQFYEDSLVSFAEEFFRDKPKAYSIAKRKFVEEYTEYCNKENATMSLIEESDWVMFTSLCVSREMRNSNSTEVFTNLKWRHVKDYPLVINEKGITNPVEYFIEQRCVKTMFDYDYITTEAFRSKYDQFCIQHEIPKIPVQNRVIEDMGCKFERKTLTYLVKGRKKIDSEAGFFSEVGSKIKNMCAIVYAWFAHKLFTLWLLQSFPSVFGHVVLSALIPLPLLLAAFIFQNAAENLTSVGHRYFLAQDAMIGPLPNTMYWGTNEPLDVTGWYIAKQNKALFYITLIFWGISMFELWAYYLGQIGKDGRNAKAEAKEKQRKEAEDSQEGRAKATLLNNLQESSAWSYFVWFLGIVCTGIRNFIKILYMPLFMFFFAGTMSYIVLILVWAILGAIINPFKFLPLAAGALTLLTAVISKAKALQNAEKKMREKIRAKMEERAQLMVMQLREKVLAKVSGIADGITGGGGGGGGSGGSSPLVAMAKKHLGDLADDPGLLLRVAKGDVKAISELSEKMGIDPMISRPIIAVAMKDVDELKRAIMPLAEKLGIDGALAGALITLASDLNSGNKQRHLKTFMNEILKLAMCGKIPIPMPKIAHEIKRSLIIARQHTGAIQGLSKDDLEAMFNDAVNGGKEKLEQFERLAEESFNAMQDLAEDAAKRQMESVIRTIQNQKDRPELAQFGVLLGALPEIASCVLQIIEAHDIEPFINLIETNRELQKVLPFPTEIISIANAILKSNRDKLQIEAIKLFAFLFGFKKLHTFLNSGSMLEEGLEAGEKSVMSFAGFLEAKVAEIMTDRAQILQAALAEKLTEELGKVDGAEAEDIRLKIKKTQAYALKLMGAAEGTVLNLVDSAEGTIVQAVSKATDAANQTVGAMKTKLEGKVQKAKATAGAVKDKLEGKAKAMVGNIEKRIRDLIPAELELMITLCALCYRDPSALEAACWISGETEDENLFHLNPSVARAIMMLAKHQEGASHPNPRAKPVKDGTSPGTFRGKMKNQLPKSVQDLIRLDMRHKAIMPIAKQLGFDNQVLAGLVALPRDSATMRWARVNEIAGANTCQATFGLVALLNNSMGVGEASSAVIQLCYKCEIENNPHLVMQILKLRQQKFNRCQRTMHDFLVAISCPTHAKAAAAGVNEYDFSDQCAAILALATATDARVLRKSIKMLAMANGAGAGPGSVKERAQLSVAIAASRRYIPPLKGHELVKLFALVVPSSGYYENQTDLKCPFYDLTKLSSHLVKSPMQEYQLSYEEIRSVLNLDVDPTSDPHKLLAGALVKIIRSNIEWIKKEKGKSEPPTEALLLTTIIEIRKAFNEEKLDSALTKLSSLCNGKYTGNDPETAPLVKQLAELQKCNAMSVDKLAKKLKKCLGVETKNSVWKKQWYALLHMSEFKEESGRVGMGKLADRKENFVQGAFSLTQGDRVSLEAIFDLSICVQGWYLGGSDMRILKTSVGKMCSLLAMPAKPMLHMICVSDPNPTEQTREVRVTMAASILQTHLNVPSKVVDKWKGLALASLKDVAYVHQSIIHVARKLRIPQELLFSLAHYSPSTSGRKADVRAVRAVMLPPAVHDDDGDGADFGVGDRKIYEDDMSKGKMKHNEGDTVHLFQNTYSDTSIGNPLVKTVSEAHNYKGTKLFGHNQKANRMQARKEDDTTHLFQTLVYNEIFDHYWENQLAQEKFKKDYEELSRSEKKWVSDEVRKRTKQQRLKPDVDTKELNESTTEKFIVALSDRHMYIEGAISLATLDPVGVTTLCKALELATKGAFKKFKFRTHGCALKLAVTLARRKLAELTEPDVDYGTEDGISLSPARFLAKKMGVPPEFITGLAVIASGNGYDLEHFTQSIGVVADGLEFHPSCINAFVCASQGTSSQLSQELLHIVESQRIFHPAVASFLVSIGSGDITGLEAACGEDFLDVDVEIVEGLVALATGNPDASRACLPRLAERMHVNSKALQLLSRTSARDFSSDHIDAMLPIFARTPEDKPVLRDVVRLFNQGKGNARSALTSLINSANFDISNIDEAEALVDFMQGHTKTPSKYFEMSTLGLNIGSLLLELLKQPRGIALDYDTICRSPAVIRFFWVSDAIGCRRYFHGLGKDMKNVGQFMSAIFVAGSKDGADQAPHTLDMESPKQRGHNILVTLGEEKVGGATVHHLTIIEINGEVQPGAGKWAACDVQSSADKQVPEMFMNGMQVGDRIYAIDGQYISHFDKELKLSGDPLAVELKKMFKPLGKLGKGVTDKRQPEGFTFKLNFANKVQVCFKRVPRYPDVATGTSFLCEKFEGMTNGASINAFFNPSAVDARASNHRKQSVWKKKNEVDEEDEIEDQKIKLFQKMKGDKDFELKTQNVEADSDLDGGTGDEAEEDDDDGGMKPSTFKRAKEESSANSIGFDVLLIKLFVPKRRPTGSDLVDPDEDLKAWEDQSPHLSFHAFKKQREVQQQQQAYDARCKKFLSVVRAVYKFGVTLASVVFEGEQIQPESGTSTRESVSGTNTRESVAKSHPTVRADLRGASMYGVTPQSYTPKVSKDVKKWNEEHWIEYTYIGFMPSRVNGGCKENVGRTSYPTIITPVITAAVELSIAIEQPAESDCFQHEEHTSIADWMGSQGHGSNGTNAIITLPKTKVTTIHLTSPKVKKYNNRTGIVVDPIEPMPGMVRVHLSGESKAQNFKLENVQLDPGVKVDALKHVPLKVGPRGEWMMCSILKDFRLKDSIKDDDVEDADRVRRRMSMTTTMQRDDMNASGLGLPRNPDQKFNPDGSKADNFTPFDFIINRACMDTVALVVDVTFDARYAFPRLSDTIFPLLLFANSSVDDSGTLLSGRPQMGVARSRSIIDSTEIFFSKTAESLHLKPSTAGVLAGILSHNQAAIAPPCGVRGSRPKYTDLNPFFQELSVEDEKQQIILYQLLLAAMGKPRILAYAKAQRLNADAALEEEVAVSIAKRVGISPEIARICLLGGICQACPQSVRPRMAVVEATLLPVVERFKVDAVAARMIVGAAARNRYCLREFVVYTACQSRAPESDKNEADIRATVAVLDAIAAEEVEMLHATSQVLVKDETLKLRDPVVYERRKDRVNRMNDSFAITLDSSKATSKVRQLTNLEVFAYDLAEEQQDHEIEGSVKLAKKIVDLVGILLNDRGSNQNMATAVGKEGQEELVKALLLEDTDTERQDAFERWDWGYDQCSKRPDGDKRFQYLAECLGDSKSGVCETIFQGIVSIGCNVAEFKVHHDFWRFGMEPTDDAKKKSPTARDLHLFAEIVQVLTAKDPWRRQMNLVKLAKDVVDQKQLNEALQVDNSLHFSDFSDDMDALMDINGSKVPDYQDVLSRLQPLYDDENANRASGSAQAAVERWGCLVGVAADSWQSLYTERGEWKSIRKKAVDGETGDEAPGTFFPGRQLFSKTFQAAQLKADNSDYDDNEEKARFNLQLLCDISAGNKSGLYLTAEYSGSLVGETKKYAFPGSAREEYCRFLKKSPASLLLKVLGPSKEGLDGVNIFSTVKEALTTSWAKDSDETGFRARFTQVLNTVESGAQAAHAAADKGEQAMRDAVEKARVVADKAEKAVNKAVNKARAVAGKVNGAIDGAGHKVAEGAVDYLYGEAIEHVEAKAAKYNVLAAKAKLLACQHAGLIDQLWKGMKLFFQMCASPESALGLADDLLDLMLSDLVVSKLQEVFAGSKVLKFVINAKRVMNQLSECKIGQFFFSMASNGKVHPGGLFTAVLQDLFIIKDMDLVRTDPQIRAIISKAEKNLERIFASKAGKLLFQKFTEVSGDTEYASEELVTELFRCVMDGIVGSDTAAAADQVAENLVELKNAFQGKMIEHLLPRIQEAIGLPSGLEIKSSIAAKSKFVTDVLVRLLSADNPQAQIEVFKEMWDELIRNELPLIVEDILNGIPAGKGKHPKPLWPKITLSPDAQIELSKALDQVKEVLGSIIEAMLSIILAMLSPIMKAVGDVKDTVAETAELLSKVETEAAGLLSKAETDAAGLLLKAKAEADGLLSKAEIEAVGLGLQVFQSILKFVQGGSDAMDSAGTLALSIGLKFGVDRKLLEGLLAIFKGTFNASVARDMATALMGNPASSSSGQAATEAICSLVGLAQGDWSQLKALAIKMGGFDEVQLEKLTRGVERLKPIIDKLKKQLESGKKQLNGNVTFDSNDDLDPNSLFMKYDLDNSGMLEFNEFFEVLKILNYPQQITENKVMKIFVAADVSKTESLNMVEFTQAIDISRKDQSRKVLNLMGLSQGNIFVVVLGLLVMLTLLFGFIFSGIFAFTTLGGFSAVVNSTFPVIGGTGASSSQEVPGSGDDDQTNTMVDSMLEKATAEDTVAE